MFITQPKVFVSSTIEDLPNERYTAYNTILKAGAFPVMSEMTIGAQNADSLTTCLNKIKESDIYILILGGRYGWQPNGKESITEIEFQTARECNLPIFVFNTTYPKEELQKEFQKRIEDFRFRKTITNVHELEKEITKVLNEEVEKKQNEYFNKSEFIYSNLVRINFPQYIYIAEVNIEKKDRNVFTSRKNNYSKRNNSLFDQVITLLRDNNISFAHDWVLDGRNIITFHNLQDSSIPLLKIIDRGTVDKFACDEYYDSSPDKMNVFKHLLKKCLETKLRRKKIYWYKEENLFAFVPTLKDNNDMWLPRTETWIKTIKKATRTVTDLNMSTKNKNEIFNLKSLAFKVKFEYMDNNWFLLIKPDWIYLRSDLKISPFGYKSIQYLKRKERNSHVFNHFNFILNILQPSGSSLFSEFEDYPFLSFGQIEKFDFSPIVRDDIWANLEDPESLKKLNDNNGKVGLFGL